MLNRMHSVQSNFSSRNDQIRQDRLEYYSYLKKTLSAKTIDVLKLQRRDARKKNDSYPRRMPNFINPTFLNNFSFSLGPNEQYEYYNRRFFKKVETICVGKSFGEHAIHKRMRQPFSYKTETPIEFAILTKEGYSTSLRSIYDQNERNKIAFLKA